MLNLSVNQEVSGRECRTWNKGQKSNRLVHCVAQHNEGQYKKNSATRYPDVRNVGLCTLVLDFQQEIRTNGMKITFLVTVTR